MKIFGSVDSFVETGETSLKLGRLVANFEFLKALLVYGSFDQYRIYCSTFDNLKLLKLRLEQAIADESVLDRVVLSHHLNFPDALRDTDFSAFHAGGWNWYLPRLAYLRAKYQASFPLTGIIHSLDTPEVMRDVRELMRAPLAACDSIICTSEPGQQVFHNYVKLVGAQQRSFNFPARLDCIPLGVSDACFATQDRVAARAKLGLDDTDVMLLYMGRMSVFTKADLVPLLYTFLQLKQETQTAICLVLAGGADAANLANLQLAISELGLGTSVLLRPNIEDAEKFSLYAAADIFVSPIDNFQETFGIAVIEAMAAGLPVVVSDFDGYRDLVQEDVHGYRIPTTWLPLSERLADLRGILEPTLSSFYAAQSVVLDDEIFVRRLRDLIDDPSLRLRLGDAGRAQAQQRFHWRSIIAAYETLWEVLKKTAGEILPQTRQENAFDPNLPALTSVFGHYPSAILSDASRLTLSERGQAAAMGNLLLPAVYQDASPLLPDGLAKWVLSHLVTQPKTLNDLLVAGRHAVCSHDDLLRTAVVWLAKHGLIRISSGE